MGLIMALSFAESAYFFSIFVTGYSCDLHLPQFFAKTIFWSSYSNSQMQAYAKAVLILEYCSTILEVFLWAATVCINYGLLKDMTGALIAPMEKQ